MTTISTADLTSELVDLSAVPLRELRAITTRQLAEAVAWEVAFVTTNLNDMQKQNENDGYLCRADMESVNSQGFAPSDGGDLTGLTA